MSTFHYIDENNNPCGPVDEANLRKIAEAARAAGRELMIAKPGDSQWLPFNKSFASGAPAAAPNRPQQLARPHAAGVRPAAAQSAAKPAPAAATPAPAQEPAQPVEASQAQPEVQHRQEPAPAPVQQHQARDAAYSRKPALRAPWLSFACYAASVLCLLALVAVIVFSVLAAIGVAGAAQSAPGGANQIPGAGALGMYGVLSLALTAAPGCLLSALFFAWAGKSLSLLNQIAHNTR